MGYAAVGLVGIALSLAVLIYLAYRGVSLIVAAPLVAAMAVLFEAPSQLLAAYTEVFMLAMGTFAAKYFPIFLLGAIFAKLMQDSGSAWVIADSIMRKLGKRYALLATVLTCGLLCYSGVSVYMVAFAVYPLAAVLFREADVPRRLIPGAIALGAFTFSPTCLPGTLQIHNLIPMPYFNTTAFAAPLLGTVGGLLMFFGGMFWLSHRVRRAACAGEGYGDSARDQTSAAPAGGCPPLWVAMTPITTVIVLNYVLSQYVFPDWETDSSFHAEYSTTSLGPLPGMWSTIIALLVAVLLTAAFNFRSFARLNQSLGLGAIGSLLPTFNTASVVGYGATIASLSTFGIIKDRLLVISAGNPLFSEAVAIGAMGATIGSASAGMSLVLETVGGTYYQLAVAHGVPLQLMHRIAAMACAGSSMPHNGAVITLLTICGLTHRQSYKDIAVVALVLPALVTFLILLLGMALGPV